MNRTLTIAMMTFLVVLIAACSPAPQSFSPQLAPEADAACASCSATASVETTLEQGIIGRYEFSRTTTIIEDYDGSFLVDSSSHRSLITPTPTVEVIRVNPAPEQNTLPSHNEGNAIRVNPTPGQQDNVVRTNPRAERVNQPGTAEVEINPLYSSEVIEALQDVYLLGEGFQVLLQIGPQINFTISNSVGEIKCAKFSRNAHCGNEDLGFDYLVFFFEENLVFEKVVTVSINGEPVTGQTIHVLPGDVLEIPESAFRY